MLKPLSLAPLASSPSREQKFLSSRGEAVAIQIKVVFNLDCFTPFAMTVRGVTFSPDRGRCRFATEGVEY